MAKSYLKQLGWAKFRALAVSKDSPIPDHTWHFPVIVLLVWVFLSAMLMLLILPLAGVAALRCKWLYGT